MVMEKKLPIGIENFEKMRTQGFYYVDKTGLIKELVHNWGEVNLFTRPRRFGKSLNMNMLKSFFEIGCKQELFDGLEIAKEAVLCREYMGKFPVISISLKDVNGDDYETARAMMRLVIRNEALRFQFLQDSTGLSHREKEIYDQLTIVANNNQESFVMSDDIIMASLLDLSRLLYKHYEQKVIILIDEYDVPLEKAFAKGYYDQMIMLLRNMFGRALKTNDNMYFSVLTGCLRISKESIFTGINNMKILSVTDVRFDEYFGFTDREVKALLEYYNLPEFYDIIKEWYNGYLFGNADVYCPWDVICYCDLLRADRQAQPEEYWINTSGNDIVRRFIEKATDTAKEELEQLIEGNTVTKTVRQELTYRELYDSVENMWSVLYTTGYLTMRGKPEGKKLHLAIPNTEIRNIFVSQIAEWFFHTVRQDGAALDAFCEAFKRGDAETIGDQFQSYLQRTISIRDTFVRKEKKENFYHGILLGLLGFKNNWKIWSNRESGEGYSDIMIKIDDEKIGIVIEVKYSDQENHLETDCKKALAQIEKKRYHEKFQNISIRTIMKYGIACYKRRCKVLLAKEEC